MEQLRRGVKAHKIRKYYYLWYDLLITLNQVCQHRINLSKHVYFPEVSFKSRNVLLLGYIHEQMGATALNHSFGST